MKASLFSEKPTRIDVWRDSTPLPGEKPITKVQVSTNDIYWSKNKKPVVVGDHAHLSVGNCSSSS